MDNIFDVQTHGAGPEGRLPLNPDFLTNTPSGDIVGWTQDVAMGWNPTDLGKDEYLILSINVLRPVFYKVEDASK